MRVSSSQIVLLANNLRSCHNVGSLLRTADGLGVTVYLTGYTPHPEIPGDKRLPYQIKKTTSQIHKTALGVENYSIWHYRDSIDELITELKSGGFLVAAVEQTENSISLPDFKPPSKTALIVGREVDGLEREILAEVDCVIEIPMFGQKESYNVVQAAAMAMYHCRFNG
jgi:tRNA G18 (ribose-2'-O)-methylase SpoU